MGWDLAEICRAKFSYCQSYSLVGLDTFGSCITVSSGFHTVSRRAHSYIRQGNTSWNRNIFWLKVKTCIKSLKWTESSALKKKLKKIFLISLLWNVITFFFFFQKQANSFIVPSYSLCSTMTHINHRIRKKQCRIVKIVKRYIFSYISTSNSISTTYQLCAFGEMF